MYKFHEEKINIQQVSRTKKSASYKRLRLKSTLNKFHEKDQHTISSMIKTIFLERKINLQVSRREK